MKTLFLYLNIVRWKNLLLLAISQVLFKFQVFPFFKTLSSTTNFEFLLLLVSTLGIAAGGYIINDVFDKNCDSINKPEKTYLPEFISVSKAKTLYVFSTFMGLISGLYLCFLIDKLAYSAIYLVIVLLLYIYSSHLKRTALIGNFVVSLLVSFNLILLLLIDSDIKNVNEGISITLLFTGFAFFINLLREIIKDIEDIKGDYNSGYKTLPIVLGIERTVNLILILGLIPLFLLINFGVRELNQSIGVQLFYWVFIVLPFFYFMYKTLKAKVKNDFSNLSTLLKCILSFGLVLIYLITF